LTKSEHNFGCKTIIKNSAETN